MLTFLILASLLAAAALALVALEVVRPPERVVNALFVVFSLLVVLLAAWTFALLLGAGSEEGARNAVVAASARRGAGPREGRSNGREGRVMGRRSPLTAAARA